jgi:lipopolysaccharide biosynthesis regulator YciM
MWKFLKSLFEPRVRLSEYNRSNKEWERINKRWEEIYDNEHKIVLMLDKALVEKDQQIGQQQKLIEFLRKEVSEAYGRGHADA